MFSSANYYKNVVFIFVFFCFVLQPYDSAVYPNGKRLVYWPPCSRAVTPSVRRRQPWRN